MLFKRLKIYAEENKDDLLILNKRPNNETDPKTLIDEINYIFGLENTNNCPKIKRKRRTCKEWYTEEH